MIKLSHVQKNFGTQTVLRDISFQLSPGERVGIIGPGGCGKSTILKILLGIVEATSGSAEILGQDLGQLPPAEREEVIKKVGMAFQQGGLFDFMTVRENLNFAMENMTHKTFEEREENIRRLLSAVKLGHTENLYPHELSGGMKRRVGIARALCTDPVVALFDEPTSGLDPVTSTIILNMILDLAGGDSQRALLVSTSNVEIAIRFADRLIVIHEGVIVADGPWRKLLVESTDWVKNFIGTRFIGLSLEYARELDLPEEFIRKHDFASA